MRKIIIISPLLLVIGIGAWILLSPAVPLPDTQVPVTLPYADQNPNVLPGDTTTETLSLRATNDGQIVTKNFLLDPSTKQDPDHTEYYNLIATSSPFLITYLSPTQYFNIVLMKEPIGEIRKDAETYLAQRLGISSVDMCSLNYTLGVPNFVNSQYAGMELGFSFCPGATALPK